MPANPVPLASLRIDQPCSQNWASMAGDDRSRFCAQCEYQVHNLSALTEREIQRLLTTNNGRLCGRLERDVFGRLKTQPERGWRNWLQKKKSGLKLAFGSILTALTANTLCAQSPAPKPVQSTSADEASTKAKASSPSEPQVEKNPAPPSIEKQDEEVVLLFMGIVSCEKAKPPIKKKYKK